MGQDGAKVIAVQRHASRPTLAQTDTVATAHSVQYNSARCFRPCKRIAWQRIPSQSAAGFDAFLLAVWDQCGGIFPANLR